MSTSNWYWSWVKDSKLTAKASSSVPQSGGIIYNYRAPERGQLSASQLKTSIDSFSTNINQQWSLWNTHIRPILDSLPSGPRDQRWTLKSNGLEKIDALNYGIQGTTLFVFNDADDTRAYGRFWDIATQRPKTIAEALEDIWIAISELDTVSTGTTGLVDLQPLWNSIGAWYQTGVASATGSLDWRLLQAESSFGNILDDIYGTNAGLSFGGFGSPTHSMAEFVHYLAVLHGISSGWNGGNPVLVSHANYTDFIQSLATFAGKSNYQDVSEVPNYSSIVHVTQGVDLVTAISELDAAITTSGGIIGPGSATTDNIIVFDGPTGSLAKDSGTTIAELAPSDSQYWVSVADAALTGAFSIGGLGNTTGALLKVVTTLGVAAPELAIGDTDYQLPLTFPTSVVRNGSDEVALDGDAASPGDNYFYGVGRTGTKGWNTRNITNHITVGQVGSDVDYNTIGEAVQAAIDAGAGTPSTNQFQITVYPGVYPESPITVPSGVNIRAFELRVDTVFVTAINPNADLFTLTGGFICGLNVFGVSNTNNCLFRIASPGTLNVLHSISLHSCSNGIIAEAGTTSVVTNLSVLISALGMGIGTVISCTGASAYMGINGMLIYAPDALLAGYSPSNPIQTVLSCTNTAEVYVASASVRCADQDATADVFFADDAGTILLNGVEVSGSGNVFHIGSTGSNTEIVTQGGSLKNNRLNVWNQNSTGKIYISHSEKEDTYTGVSGATLAGIVQVREEELVRIIGEAEYRYLAVAQANESRSVGLARFFAEHTSTGITSGGVVTDAGGLVVNITDVEGWVRRGGVDKDSYLFFHVNPNLTGYTALTLTASVTNYIYYDAENDVFNKTISPIAYGDSVLLATAITNGSDIRFLHQTRNPILSPMEQIRDYLLATRKTILKSGMSVSLGSTSLKFNVDSGTYYVALDQASFTGDTDVTFSYFWGVDGYTEVATQTGIDDERYWDTYSNTLVALSTGYFKSDTIVCTSDGRVSVLYGTTEYLTQSEAEASPLEQIPSFIDHTAIPVAQLVIEDGNGIVSIVDVRPTGDGSGSVVAGGAGVSVHSELTGLELDDHQQYMILTGARAMTGALNMGTKNITNAGTINGVTIEDHSALHQPGGADALTMGLPTGLTVGAVQYLGNGTSFAYSNHVHAIPGGAVGDMAAVGVDRIANSLGVSSSFARVDHAHGHGTFATSATLYHALATGTNPGFMSSAHYTKLDTQAVTYVSGSAVTSGNFPAFSGTTGKVIVDSGYGYSAFATAVHTHPYEPTFSKGGFVISGPLTSSGTLTSRLYDTGNITIGIQTASGSLTGALSSSDWTIFNNKIGGSSGAQYTIMTATGSGTINSSDATYTGGALTIGSSAASYLGSLKMYTTASAGRYLTITPSSSQSANYALVMPTTAGTVNYLLGNNPSTPGVLTWIDPATLGGGPGDVIGDDTTGVVDGHIVVYNGTTGKHIKSSDTLVSGLVATTGTQTIAGAKTWNPATLIVGGASTGVGTLAYATSPNNATLGFQAITGTIYSQNGQDISVADGGTGKSTWTNGAVWITTDTFSSGTLTVPYGGTGRTSFTAATGVVVTTSSTAIDSVGYIGVAYGGTGITTYTIGDLIYANGASSLTRLTSTALASRFLKGGASAPSWAQVNVTDLYSAGSLGYLLTVGSSNTVTYVANTMHSHITGTSYPTSCTYVGSGALDASSGDYNTAVGHNALTSVNSSAAVNNTAVGASAGESCTNGIDNTFIGKGAGSSVTTSDFHVMIGVSAGAAIVGSANGVTAVGYQSGMSITSGSIVALGYYSGKWSVGSHNTCAGTQSLTGSLSSVSSAAECSAFGFQSLANVAGANNSAFGSSSLTSATSGTGNSAFGYNSGNQITTGSYNALFGSGATTAAVSTVGATALGFGAIASSEIYYTVEPTYAINVSGVAIGRSARADFGIAIGGCYYNNDLGSVSSQARSIGHGINIGSFYTNAADTEIRIGSSGVHTSWYNPSGSTAWTSSDERLKSSIQDSELGLSFISSLRPVSYHYKRTLLNGTYTRDSSRKHLGFIAQEVLRSVDSSMFGIVNDPTINNPSSKEFMSLNYQDFIAPMVKAIQEQQVMIDQLRSEIKSLKGE